MIYMMLVYADENSYAPGEREACMQESLDLTHVLHEKGQYIAASPLESVSTATSVRVRSGKRIVTDGPFAETREQLGGYYLVDVDNLDEAIAIAGKIPGARKGTVEIRPVFQLAGLPNKELSKADTHG